MTYQSSTDDFREVLDRWQNMPPGHAATDADIAELALVCKSTQKAPGWMYAITTKLMLDRAIHRYQHVGSTKAAEAAIRKDVQNWRIHADLGCVPETPQEFIRAWLKVNSYEMEFSGLWQQHGGHSPHNNHYILSGMKLWGVEFGRFSEKNVIDLAFDLYVTDEKVAMMKDSFNLLKFNPTMDPGMTELKRMVRMIIRPAAFDEETERNYAAAEIAFANLIYRIKNHMRYNWKNSAHLMIVLSGVQGDGKTTLIEHLMSVLRDMFTLASLDDLKDRSQFVQLSVMPCMLFEEMQGATKTDIDELKAIMTGKSKMMRENYEKAGVRRLMTTFIGAANKDIRNLIKDETGNRRFIQFLSRKVSRAEIYGLDVLKIWQSVDENAVEPPMYATDEAQAIISQIQSEQATAGPVEQWLMHCDDIPWDTPIKANKVFGDFMNWCVDEGAMTRAEANHWSGNRLRDTLRELALKTDRFDIKETRTGGSPSFRIQRPTERVMTAIYVECDSNMSRTLVRGKQQGKYEAILEAECLAGEWEPVSHSTGETISLEERMTRRIAIQRGLNS